jgi:Tfp pilus assembly protein PilZ
MTREKSMTTNAQVFDRRRHERVPFDAPVRIEKVPKLSTLDSENLLSEELSEGGIRLSSPRFFSVQDRLLLELETAEEPVGIRAVGTVVWVEQSSYQFKLGIELSDLSESDRSRLRAVIRERQAPY